MDCKPPPAQVGSRGARRLIYDGHDLYIAACDDVFRIRLESAGPP